MQVDSEPDALTGDEDEAGDQLVAFPNALIADPRVLGPAAGLENPTGVVGATFQVMAGRLEDAQGIAGTAFNEALATAGIDSRWQSIDSDDEPPL